MEDEINDILPVLNLLSSIKTAFPFLDVGLFDLISPSKYETKYKLVYYFNLNEKYVLR
jgi:hypothetical protein